MENNDTDEPPEKKARASSPRPCVAVAPNNAIPSPTKSQLPVGLINPNPAAVVSPSSVVKPCSVSPSGPCKPNTPSPALPNVAKVGPQTTLAAALTPPTIVKAPVSLCAAPPLNHKAHLLQAVANQAKTPVPMTPKAHILQSINVVSLYFILYSIEVTTQTEKRLLTIIFGCFFTSWSTKQDLKFHPICVDSTVNLFFSPIF